MNLAELRESSREKADESSGGYIGPAELDRYINQGARMIHGKIVQFFGDDYTIPGTLLNGGLFSTVVGTNNYSIPATFKKLVKLEWRPAGSTNDNEWRRIKKVSLNNDQRLNDYQPRIEGYGPSADFGYFLTKNDIYLRPVPVDVFSARSWFVPRFTLMVLATDIPDIPEDYHDLISEFASIQCLRKSGEPIYKEAMDVFNLELKNMLETVDYRDQQPEFMQITDDMIYEG